MKEFLKTFGVGLLGAAVIAIPATLFAYYPEIAAAILFAAFILGLGYVIRNLSRPLD